MKKKNITMIPVVMVLLFSCSKQTDEQLPAVILEGFYSCDGELVFRSGPSSRLILSDRVHELYDPSIHRVGDAFYVEYEDAQYQQMCIDPAWADPAVAVKGGILTILRKINTNQK